MKSSCYGPETSQSSSSQRSTSRFGPLFEQLVAQRRLVATLLDELPRSEQGYFQILKPPPRTPPLQITRPTSPPSLPRSHSKSLAAARRSRPFSPPDCPGDPPAGVKQPDDPPAAPPWAGWNLAPEAGPCSGECCCFQIIIMY